MFRQNDSYNFTTVLIQSKSRITINDFPRTECAMDLRRWESLWKVFATIGIANLLLFVVIVFVNEIYDSILLWILIAIETSCYLGVLIVRRHIRQLLR